MPDSIVIMWESDTAGEAACDCGRSIQYDHRKKDETTGARGQARHLRAVILDARRLLFPGSWRPD